MHNRQHLVHIVNEKENIRQLEHIMAPTDHSQTIRVGLVNSFKLTDKQDTH